MSKVCVNKPVVIIEAIDEKEAQEILHDIMMMENILLRARRIRLLK